MKFSRQEMMLLQPCVGHPKIRGEISVGGLTFLSQCPGIKARSTGANMGVTSRTAQGTHGA